MKGGINIMEILSVLYPYRKYITAVLAIFAAFGFGFYQGRVTAPVQTVTVENPVEKVVTETVTQTDIRYIPKGTPADPDIDIKIPKQQLTVSVNGKEHTIQKSDSEKYVFDKNQLQLEQYSKAVVDIKIPTIDKTRRWSIGIGVGKDGAAYMLRAPLKNHVGLWTTCDKKTIMGGVSFDF